MKARILLFIPAFVYTIAILYLSLIDLGETPVKDMDVSDKILHGGAYFGLGLVWIIFAILGFRDTRFLTKVLMVSVSAVVFGIFIEVLQDRLTSYRRLDVYDILANSVGVIGSGIVVYFLKNSLIRLKAKINSFFMKK